MSMCVVLHMQKEKQVAKKDIRGDTKEEKKYLKQAVLTKEVKKHTAFIMSWKIAKVYLNNWLYAKLR